MTAWVLGTRMDAGSFAHHFFGRATDDPVAGSLRAAATETAEATTRPQLATASQHLADAMTTEGLDGWPRFVTRAQVRAHEKATLAAVAKSLQPVVPRSAADGKSGSDTTESGTKLAMAPVGAPDEISEGGGEAAGHGGGAMPDIGPPTATQEVMPPAGPGGLAPSAPPAEGAPQNPTAPAAAPSATIRGLPPEGVSPPGIDPRDLTPGPASRPFERAKGGESLYDKSGGEWRYFPGDSRHNPHWDYKPGGSPNSGWQNIPIGNHPIMK
jgi:hypothetical protein